MKIISFIKSMITAIPKTIGLLVVLVTIGWSQNVNTYIPQRAMEHRDTLYKSIKENIPELSDYNYVPALIEHESCISLTHSKCWSPTSELNNKREYSVGFFQIAKAYNPDGSVRMDTLTSMKNKYKSRLKEASWENLKYRPDLQFTVGNLLIGENYRRYSDVKTEEDRLAFTDQAYNGGPKWVDRERTACSLKSGCNPDKYFGNVETTCQRSKKPIPTYGGRSICSIANGHTKDVLKVRMPKYQNDYFNLKYLEDNK